MESTRLVLVRRGLEDLERKNFRRKRFGRDELAKEIKVALDLVLEHCKDKPTRVYDFDFFRCEVSGRETAFQELADHVLMLCRGKGVDLTELIAAKETTSSLGIWSYDYLKCGIIDDCTINAIQSAIRGILSALGLQYKTDSESDIRSKRLEAIRRFFCEDISIFFDFNGVKITEQLKVGLELVLKHYKDKSAFAVPKSHYLVRSRIKTFQKFMDNLCNDEKEVDYMIDAMQSIIHDAFSALTLDSYHSESSDSDSDCDKQQ